MKVFKQLVAKMKSLGSEVPESMLLTRILSTLLKRYNHFRNAWGSGEEKKKNLENLTATLMKLGCRNKKMLKKGQLEQSQNLTIN